MKRVFSISAAFAAAMGSMALTLADNGVPVQPPLKIPGAFIAPAEPKWDPDSLLVRFAPQVTVESRDLMRAMVGGTLEKAYDLVPGLEHVKVTVDVQTAIDTLNMFQGMVVYAEPDYIVHRTVAPNDTYYAIYQWGMNNTGQTVNGDPGTAGDDINAPEAWDITTGSSTLVIADIDTGMNYTHADLAANSWINPGEIAGNGIDDDGNGYIDDTRGWDFANNDNDPIDDNGHGTHTAGTIGAVGNNGIGVAGVAWTCKIMPLKFLNAAGSGSTSGAIAALNYAVNKGVKVSNNSWGGGGFSQALLDAINNAGAAGHIFVAAAGNGGADGIGDNDDAIPFYPATYTAANIISVAATTNDDGRASFSNYGATTVDLGAPGQNIVSTYQTGYAFLSGTSMATPHVTGVVALVQSLHPTWTYQQVKQQILSTARPIPALAGIAVSGGVLNAFAAVGGAPVNTAPTVTISSPANGATFNTGASITFTGTATDTQDGTITASLSWTSSLQGAIGTGGTFSRSDLVVGTHVITASVTDSGGLTGTATRTITVQTPVNTAPTVTISSPTNGATFNTGTSITFTGTATDTQDGTLTASLSWTSSLQGAIGTGGTFSRSDLVVGTHVITASVTDSGGLTGTATRTITVQNPPPAPPAAPSNLTATRLSLGTARLNWTDNANNETGFDIERQQRVGGRWTNTVTIGPLAANTVTYTDSPGSSRWRYRVRATNSAGASAYTGWVTVDLR